MRRTARRAALLTAAACAMVTFAVAGPAQAIPHAGPNQSITITYYATAAKTQVVGEWSYGYCGEPFQWGRKTSYTTLVTINC
jgi:hypothetical protein